MKTLGTVTFTGQYGDLTDSVTITILPEDLTKAKVCNYDVKTGKVSVCYDGQLLEEGIDGGNLRVSKREKLLCQTLLCRRGISPQKQTGQAVTDQK